MISILTPTYNRGYTLRRLYESLKAQTHQDFEWVIVDDGSLDDTRELVEGFAREAAFPVNYFYQENGGKHVAINSGVDLSTGTHVFIVDSDDVLTPDAIGEIITAVNDGGMNYVGFCYRKSDLNGALIGMQKVNAPPGILTPTLVGRLVMGDLAYVFRKTVLQRNRFPVFKGERFVPELYVWNKIADDGEIKFFLDRTVYLCEYLADGYSANFKRNMKRNPRGFGLYYREQIARESLAINKLKCLVRLLQCIYYRATG